jgi:hypothetical protein
MVDVMTVPLTVVIVLQPPPPPPPGGSVTGGVTTGGVVGPAGGVVPATLEACLLLAFGHMVIVITLSVVIT